MASVTKQNCPEMAMGVSKMLPAPVDIAVSSTGWEVTLLCTDDFLFHVTFVFLFWACPGLYLSTDGWKPVTHQSIKQVSLKAPFRLVGSQKVLEDYMFRTCIFLAVKLGVKENCHQQQSYIFSLCYSLAHSLHAHLVSVNRICQVPPQLFLQNHPASTTPGSS